MRPQTVFGTAGQTIVWTAWHLLTALGVVLAASHVRMASSVWDLSPRVQAFIGSLALAHLLAAALLASIAYVRRRVWLRDAVLAVAATYGVLSFLLLLSGSEVSRSILLMALVLSFVSLTSSMLLRRASPVLVPLLLISIGFLFAYIREPDTAMASAATEETSVSSTFYDMRLITHNRVIPSTGLGGGLSWFGDGILVAAGDGGLYYFEEEEDPTRTPSVRALPYRVPLNREAFAERVHDDLAIQRFRVSDILIEDGNTSLRLYAAHHYRSADSRCFVKRVSVIEAPKHEFLAGTADAEWATLYDTAPCLDVPSSGFAGHESGGRLVDLDSESILLSVGDHGFDGWNTERRLAQEPDSHYGKTIRVDRETGEASVHSLGHRNPQGLLRSADGRIWLTEHGPKGGDELNLVTSGENYGWPMATYGAQYDMLSWPLSASQGRQDGYVKPTFAWLPSVGVSNLIQVEGDSFPLWKGDLLVASLGGRTLYRVRLRNDQVELVEAIDTHVGARDIIESPDGRIVFLIGHTSIGFLEPTASAEDEISNSVTRQTPAELAFARCQSCHAIGGGSNHGAGPDLGRLIGRDIASAPGYGYSDALGALPGSWTEERLDRFLKDPAAFAPGTSMETGGIQDRATRAMLVQHLVAR